MSLDELQWLVGLALATLVSEDLACIGGGLLVAAGQHAFVPVATACFLGIFVGDLLLVLAGRVAGERVLAMWPFSTWVSRDALLRAERWFERRGAGVILASRFLPGTRLPTYLAVGVLRVSWRRFVPLFALACALWTPLLVALAMWAGDAAQRWLVAWTHAVPVMIAAGVLTWAVVTLAVRAATWRGRRLLYGSWQRATRWEFWPMWAVYPPVVIYILWLGLKHRGATVFTAVNPGIEAGGGLVGESKSGILRGLAGAGDTVAAWTLVEPGEPAVRVAAVEVFAARHGWPVVLKPDVGERGAGVVIARDAAVTFATFAQTGVSMIAQAYVPGVEFGVFYFRHPHAAHGDILAVTDKRMVAVTGDGRSSLERLILADERAVCMARFFLEKFAARLDEIPAAGERVALTELGTHCRGALFLDGGELITPALLAAVERTSRAFDGFFFGRYDVRAASAEAFRAGEFKVIELNGVSSEATSIYDPRHSVWFGWRTLMRQWRIAFEIGAANRARGVRPLTLRDLFNLVTAPRNPHP